MKIKITYTCAACGIFDRTIDVKAREDEPINLWLDGLAVEIGNDHTRQSPTCLVPTISHVKIPIQGTRKVGGPMIN